MSLTRRSLLSTMICLALYGPAYAEQDSTVPDGEEAYPKSQCLAPSERTQDPNTQPVTIVADEATAEGQKTAVYKGDVVIKQGYRTVTADEVTLDHAKNEVTAQGNVVVDDGQMEVRAPYVESNLNNQDTTVRDASYTMLCQPGRGEAKRVFKNGTTFYELEDGSFTTCPAEDNSWRFTADKLEKEDGDIFADLKGARFEVLDVPVIYIPYLRVPVEDGRLTGFLYPSAGLSTRDGFELATPFYWNIAPQYDMVITPKYMSRRGLQLDSTFRYLTDGYGRGSLTGEYMQTDELNRELGHRWGFNWKHAAVQNHWKFNADYSKVSDIDYFADFSSDIGQREDNTLLQTASMSYRDTFWDSTVTVRDFQALTLNTPVYRLMPQLSFNYYRPDLAYNMNFKMPSSISVFKNNDPKKPEATRVNFEPTLTIPYYTPWLQLSAEGKIYYTHYDQSFQSANVDAVGDARLKEKVDRTIPSARLHAGITLERHSSLFGEEYAQTLEPQVQYLYIKDVDQSGIYNPVNYNGGGYDTARLQTDYYGLFRANQYSSVDYINPANQFTIGLSSRVFDGDYRERFNVSFGQIFYISQPSTSQGENINFSAWAIESEYNYNDRLFVRGSMEYDANIDDLQFGNLVTEYRDGGFYAQASYRYVSQEYIQSTLPNNSNANFGTDGINQAGIVAGFPVSNKISVSGKYFRDLVEDNMLDSEIGLTYRSDCWVIGLSFSRYMMYRSSINQPPEYDSNITFSFSLLGLGANTGFGHGDSGGTSLGYGNPFTLRN